MDNQHRKIKGYRELSQEEVDLMNAIKTKGAELLELQAKLVESLSKQQSDKKWAADLVENGSHHDSGQVEELARFEAAEPQRWAAIGKTDIQTGIMALVRAVAQPAGV
ncbi:hypothetical protein NAV33_07410 [Pseudomonas stutzeri]|uniref:Acb2/Tad1 domain-containing protein n=1 Tax=Stutzerimonas stutzeri TaxID=316 RepID=UPI00210A8AAD|nr:hypothetical protein [Stutzerimonas stutzeri]MCQ4311722.1 hypothetical protein [Stutzerimonas stutzeri]